jgi:hypothetical protein
MAESDVCHALSGVWKAKHFCIIGLVSCYTREAGRIVRSISCIDRPQTRSVRYDVGCDS